MVDEITTGDARELAKRIPDASVDLVFTDPVYERIDDYAWLASEAARVLKPNSAALIWHGIGYLPETLDALRAGGLVFRWQIACHMPAGSGYVNCSLNSNWRSLLIFGNGTPSTKQFARDSLIDGNASLTPSVHRWSKNPTVLAYYLQAFTKPGAVVWEPFAGGGTIPAVCKMLGRHYIASEIDPATAERARERVLNTQPPLPGLVVEQEPLMELV